MECVHRQPKAVDPESVRCASGNMASMFGLPESLAIPDPDAEFDPILDVLAKIAKKFGKSIFQLSCVCVLNL